MKRSTKAESYGWAEAQRDLEDGLHPEVVAARLGEPIDHLLEVADQRGWPVSHRHHVLPSPDETLDNFSRMYGFDK
jgi:hypothetical protein